MDNLKKFAFGSLTFFALLFIACESANSPQESAPFVAVTWTGREACPPTTPQPAKSKLKATECASESFAASP